MIRRAGVSLVLLLVVVSTPGARAQEVRVVRVGFEGPLEFPVEQLRLRVRTRANRHLLGIHGLTWWLWVHRVGSSVGGGIGRGIRSIGEPPAFLDPRVLAADVERLRLFYVQEGFRSATVHSRVDTLAKGDRVAVLFVVEPGAPTHVRSVRYDGLDRLEPAQKRALLAQSLLGYVADTTPPGPRPTRLGEADPALGFRPHARRYSEPLLLEEGQRILTFLRNGGYAAVTRDSIHAVIVPVRPDSFDVVFDVRTGPRFRFGDLTFAVHGPERLAPPRADTVALASSDGTVPGGLAHVTFEGERRIDPDLFLRTLQLRPGDWYDQSRLASTKRRLDAAGVFAFTEYLALPQDTLRLSPASALRLPHRFELQARPRHQLRFQSFMLQRSGALADSDNEIGTGLGMTYGNLNLFGEGESFRLSSTGTVAADLGGSGGFTSAQWEISGTLGYPYLVFPFGRLERLFSLYDARTQFSLSLVAARRDALRLVLRGRGSARFRLEMRHSAIVTSIVDVLDLSVSNPDTLDGFGDIFLRDILASVDDPIQRGQIVEDYTEPQINNALRYTFRSARLDPFKRDQGHSYEASVELGGNLPYALDRWIYSPGDIDGSIPGLPFFRSFGSDSRLIYRQYIRLVGDFRRFLRLDPASVLAWKGLIGVAQPTGRADVVPFDRRFYSGGASSVRAWRLRQLGPGGASFLSDSVTTGSTNLLGGEIKLEGSVEFRRTVVHNLIAADWVFALFADAGNVWSGPRNPGPPAGRFRLDRFWKEIGVGAGAGVRLAWEYLILRLDFAYKVHDPRRQGVILPDGFSSPVVQFGIGHTF